MKKESNQEDSERGESVLEPIAYCFFRNAASARIVEVHDADLLVINKLFSFQRNKSSFLTSISVEYVFKPE